MAMKARYTVVDGEVIAEKRSGVRKSYVPDPLGSTVALLDISQAPTDIFSYWPYGEQKSHTGTTTTPFQFVGTLGYYRDSSSRTYVRARTLRTDLGRWLTEDPIGFDGGDINLHKYVGNNPTTAIDPRGMQGDTIIMPGPKLHPPYNYCHTGPPLWPPSAGGTPVRPLPVPGNPPIDGPILLPVRRNPKIHRGRGPVGPPRQRPPRNRFGPWPPDPRDLCLAACAMNECNPYMPGMPFNPFLCLDCLLRCARM